VHVESKKEEGPIGEKNGKAKRPASGDKNCSQLGGSLGEKLTRKGTDISAAVSPPAVHTQSKKEGRGRRNKERVRDIDVTCYESKEVDLAKNGILEKQTRK